MALIRRATRIATVTAIVFTMSFFIGAPTLLAGESSGGQFEFELDNSVEYGEGEPSLTIRALTALHDAQVILERSDGNRQVEKLGNLDGGESRAIAIEQGTGSFGYDAELRAKTAGGDPISMTFNFQAEITREMEVDLIRDEIDLDSGHVPIQINQPVDRVEITITDENNRPTLEETQSFGGASGRLNVRWDAEGSIGAVRLKIHYGQGAWYEYILEPFFIEIPEQIINFETGSASVDESEEGKLRETRDRVSEALDKAGDRRSEMHLYVAGYTDTVGSAANNLELSTRRARSIAAWFRNHGIDIPIYYQGFGQEVLAVQTPDQTEEERNRRAVYVLGNAPPPASEDLPRANWRRLR